MDAEDGHLGAAGCGQHQPDEAGQHQRLDHVGYRCGGVLEVGAPVGHVGDREEGRLRGDAAHGVGDREPGIAGRRADDGGDQSGQGGGGAKEHRAGHRLTDAEAIGKVVDDLGQPHTGGDQHAARKEQRGDGPSEGP